MNKHKILVICLFLMSFQAIYSAQAAQASVTARKKPLNLESLQSNFDDLKKLLALSPGNTTEIFMKLGRIDKLIRRLEKDENPLVAAIQAELVSIKRDLGYGQQLDQYSIPLLPEVLAHNYYPVSAAVCPHTGSVIDFQRTAPLPIGFSPDRGWVIATNGFIKGLIDGTTIAPQETRDLAKILFNISQEGNVVLTALYGNPAISISPLLAAQLIRLVHTGVLDDPANLTPEQFEKLAPFFREWYATYQKEQATKLETIKSQTVFTSRAKEVLKEIAASAQKDRSLTTDLLLAVVALRMKQLPFLDDQVTVFKEYGTALTGTEPKIIWYYQDDIPFLVAWYQKKSYSQESIASEIEHISFCMRQLATQNNLRDLVFFDSEGAYSTYDGVSFASCAENSLRTLLTMIFYDPKIGALSLYVVPKAVQESLSPELKAFIADHGVLKRKGNLTAEEQQAAIAADQAFLGLVENRAGILYHKKSSKGQEYEIDPSLENFIKILMQLFGLPVENKEALPQEQFVALLEQVSTPEHQVVAHFEKLEGENTYFFKVSLSLLKSNQSFDVRLQLGPRHAAVFLIQNLVAIQRLTETFTVNVYQASVCAKLFFLGSCVLSPSVLTSYLTKAKILSTKEDWERFFDFYTSNFYQKKFPDFFYDNDFLIYSFGKYFNSGQGMRAFMESKGYNKHDAFSDALKKRDHNSLYAFLDSSSPYKPSVKQFTSLLDLINVLPNSVWRKYLLDVVQKQIDLSQPFSFQEGEQTPLVWACDNVKRELVFDLLSRNIGLYSKSDCAKVLEFLVREKSVTAFTYEKFFESMKAAHFSLTDVYPFAEGSMTVLKWALQVKNVKMIEALTFQKDIQFDADDVFAIFNLFISEFGKTIVNRSAVLYQLHHSVDFSDVWEEEGAALLENALSIGYLDLAIALIQGGINLQSPEQIVALLELLPDNVSAAYRLLRSDKFSEVLFNSGFMLSKEYPFSQGAMTPLAWGEMVQKSEINSLLKKWIAQEAQQRINQEETLEVAYE